MERNVVFAFLFALWRCDSNAGIFFLVRCGVLGKGHGLCILSRIGKCEGLCSF